MARERRGAWVLFSTSLYARRSSLFSALPTPTDSPEVVVSGPDPDRVLLVGSGVVVGTGVTSYNLGLAGHLARIVAVATGHGVSIEIAPIAGLLARSARARLEQLAVRRYDAVVLSMGLNDALGFTPRASWAAAVNSTLDYLESTMAADARIFLVAIADPSQSPLFRPLAARFAGRHARGLNEETARIVASRPRVRMLRYEVGPISDSLRLYDTKSYARWANELAPQIVEFFSMQRSNRSATKLPYSTETGSSQPPPV
jgi:lysophospholipase L1-like esterase